MDIYFCASFYWLSVILKLPKTRKVVSNYFWNINLNSRLRDTAKIIDYSRFLYELKTKM